MEIEGDPGMLKESYKRKHFAHVQLHGEITKDVAERVIEEIQRACQEFASRIDDQKAVLLLSIHCIGGSIYEANRIVGALNYAKRFCVVATLIDSVSFSIAMSIFCCGDDGFRFASPHCTAMIHQPVIRKRQKPKTPSPDLEEENDMSLFYHDHPSPALYKSGNPIGHLRTVQEQTRKSILQCLDSMDSKTIELERKMLEHQHEDWFLTAEDLLYYGLANHIGIPTFVHQAIYQPVFYL